MPEYAWNGEKNAWLKQYRGICFEDVIEAIEKGDLLAVRRNTPKYPNQQVYSVLIGSYVYLVPFIDESQERRFLKTIIPSRKETKKWRGGVHKK